MAEPFGADPAPHYAPARARRTTEAVRDGLDIAIELVTAEAELLGVFGAEASAAVLCRPPPGALPRETRPVITPSGGGA